MRRFGYIDARTVKRILLSTITILTGWLFVGCSAGSSVPLDESTAGTYGTTGTVSSTIGSTLGTNATTSTLPPNLFSAPGTDTAPAGYTTSTGTVGYVAPTGTVSTTSATTAYPLSQLQAQCLQSSSVLFNGVSSLEPTTSYGYGTTTPTYSYPSTGTSCYSGTPITQTSVYNTNLANLNTSNTCLQIALSMAPTATDPTSVEIATVQAEVAVLRCVQYEVQQAQGVTTWNSNQAQVYANTNSQLYSYLNQLGQQYPSVPAYTGPLAAQYGYYSTGSTYYPTTTH